MKSILIPVEDHDRMDGVLETALVFARKFDAYLEGIPLGPDIAEMVAADFSMSGVIFDDRTRREFLRNAAETFEGFMSRKGVQRRSDATQGPSFGWMGEALVSPTSVGEYGRVFDIIVVGRPGAASHEPHRSTLETALFESGRPLLIAPPEPATTIGDTVAIAWNGSSETARTIAFRDAAAAEGARRAGARRAGPAPAGPIRRADRPRATAARHPPRAPSRSARRAARPGRALLGAAQDLGADLMIKGGYTQSRIRQMIFGGGDVGHFGRSGAAGVHGALTAALLLLPLAGAGGPTKSGRMRDGPV